MYTIEFSKLAEKKFNKLDKSIKKRTINKLKEIRRANKPRRFLESLKGVTARKLRVGGMRTRSSISSRWGIEVRYIKSSISSRSDLNI